MNRYGRLRANASVHQMPPLARCTARRGNCAAVSDTHDRGRRARTETVAMRYRVLVPAEPSKAIPRGAAVLEYRRDTGGVYGWVFAGHHQYGCARRRPSRGA